MLISAAILALVGAAALAVTVAEHSYLAGIACIALSALGLLLVCVDVWRTRRRRSAPGPAGSHTLDADLFEPNGLDRDVQREERVAAKDMLGAAVPHEEMIVGLLGGWTHRHHRDWRRFLHLARH